MAVDVGNLSGRRRRLPMGPVEVEGIPVRQAPQLRRTRGRRLQDAEERAVGGLKGQGKARSRGSRRRAFWLGEGRLQERLRGASGKGGAADGVAGLRHVGETFLGGGEAVFSLLWIEREWVCSCRVLPGSRLFVPRSRRTTDFGRRSLKKYSDVSDSFMLPLRYNPTEKSSTCKDLFKEVANAP